MATYQCTEQGAKVWAEAVGLGGVIDGVSLNAIVTAEKIGAALYITKGTQKRMKGWSKLQWFKLVEGNPVPPPPPASGQPIYLTAHYADESSERYVPE